MRILILSWRCPRNPRAGGAESLTYEIARRLVAGGHSVEWFSASFPGAIASEVLDGVRIQRAGRQWTVHWLAFRHYVGSLRGRFDVVIDEVNTMPFFTPLWANIPTVLLIFQLAREVWWYESPFPLNAIGFAIEPLYLRLYRRARALTISKSTERDLRGLGFTGRITQVPIGIDSVDVFASQGKAATPTFLYVGRLVPSKRLEHMLEALVEFRRVKGDGTLWLAGDGSHSYQRSLVRQCRRLAIESNVVFWGRVSSSVKHRLMAEAHALLMTSVREGWGLVVTEANACGTPAIVYDVPGLRDAVRNELTGLVVEPEPVKLADAMIRLASDSGFSRGLADEALRWSKTFSFDQAAQVVGAAIGQMPDA